MIETLIFNIEPGSLAYSRTRRFELTPGYDSELTGAPYRVALALKAYSRWADQCWVQAASAARIEELRRR